jgi:hypothetical protein
LVIAKGRNRRVEPLRMDFLLGFTECHETRAEWAVPRRQG